MLEVPGLWDAAVVCTAQKRPHYLERTLDSWSKAKGLHSIRSFTIALGASDVQTEQVRVIVEAEEKFKETPFITILHDSERARRSNGMHRAIGEAANRVFQDPDVNFLILSEEDVVVSDDILLYMAWAKEKFKDDPRVLCVCAHNVGGTGWDKHEPPEDADADQEHVRLLSYYNPWTWGVWRGRWEQIMEPEWDYECNSGTATTSGYDWCVATKIMPGHKLLSVVPDASRSQNFGRYDGWASNEFSWSFSQSKSFRECRKYPRYRLIENE